MAPPLEISIPSTSLHRPADGSKPYTLYNITLRLPLRSFVVQKRYSDFAALHTALSSLVGCPPPEPLPGKSWFRSTVSSPELTEQRRAGLERYLRAVAESPDRRWRDTPAWRAFLNLPSSGPGAGAIEARLPAIGLRDANLAAAADPRTWLDLHRELKAALHDARVALGRRDGAPDGSARAEAAAQAKKALVRAGSLLAALADGLRLLKDADCLGEGELRRRRDLVAAARVERDGLELLSSSVAVGGGDGQGGGGVASAGERAALMGSGIGRTGGGGGGGGGGPLPPQPTRGAGRVLGAPLAETERTRELDNGGVLQLQRDMMAEQDAEVEALARIVRRQKEMGLAIHDEVTRQVEMLDQLAGDVDVVDRKLRVARDRERRL